MDVVIVGLLKRPISIYSKVGDIIRHGELDIYVFDFAKSSVLVFIFSLELLLASETPNIIQNSLQFGLVLFYLD